MFDPKGEKHCNPQNYQLVPRYPILIRSPPTHSGSANSCYLRRSNFPRIQESQPGRGHWNLKKKRRTPRYIFFAASELMEEKSEVRIASRLIELNLRGCYLDMMNPFPVGTLIQLKIWTDESSVFQSNAGHLLAGQCWGWGAVPGCRAELSSGAGALVERGRDGILNSSSRLRCRVSRQRSHHESLFNIASQIGVSREFAWRHDRVPGPRRHARIDSCPERRPSSLDYRGSRQNPTSLG
jgi:hypothetical protein